MDTTEKKEKLSVKDITLIALMAAVICVLGPITIPIGPVPLSFANLAIYLTVILLGWKKGTISVLIYLLIGLVGLPVFSNFSGGVGKLFGPTGGYLLGYLFVAMVGGLFTEKFAGKKYMYMLGMVLGTMCMYTAGTIWLAYQGNLSFAAALWAGVIPFIPGDMIKIIIAVLAGMQIKKRIC